MLILRGGTKVKGSYKKISEGGRVNPLNLLAKKHIYIIGKFIRNKYETLGEGGGWYLDLSGSTIKKKLTFLCVLHYFTYYIFAIIYRNYWYIQSI